MKVLIFAVIFTRSIFCDAVFLLGNYHAPGTECPPAYLVRPCTCDADRFKEANLECRNITNNSILLDVLHKSFDYKYKKLSIYNSTMMGIPAEALNDKFIEELEVHDSIFNCLFDGLPIENSLRFITLNNTKFMRGIEWNYFASSKNLESYEINNVKIHKLDEDFMISTSKRLVQVFIINSSLRKLNDKTFSQFEILRILHIDGGSISTLKRSMFSSSLRNMIFRNQKISVLPRDLFTNMPELWYVIFSGNLLKTLDEKVFNFNLSLDRAMLMDNNPIYCGCNIKWITTTQKTNITGTCAEPEFLEGTLLSHLRVTDFTHC